MNETQHTANSANLTAAGLPVPGSGERQIQDIRLNKPNVLAVKIAVLKDVDYEKR
jgi:hypothetical protein